MSNATHPVKQINLAQARLVGLGLTEGAYPNVHKDQGAEALRAGYEPTYPIYPVQFENRIYSIPPELYKIV